MKKNKILILGLLAALTSCDLTLTPEDSVSPETYFKTATDFQLWSNSFYTQFTTADAAAGMNGDDMVDNTPQDVIKNTRSASTQTWSWTVLRKINYMLAHSSQCSDESVRKEYEGVAYFFRAYFYFCKVRQYGDVPWYDEVIDSDDYENLQKARDSREYVMDKVMEDLDNAIAMLPSTKDAARVNKWTALAFKSRIALFEGTFRKYHALGNYEDLLKQAADAALEVINNGGYSLYSEGTEPYRDLFVSEEAIESEVILTRRYNAADLSISTSIQSNITTENAGFTKRFMNHYLMADGSRITSKDGYETMLYYQETQNRDPRMAQTVLCPGYVQKGNTTATVNKLIAVTGYQPIKFVADKAKDSASQGTADFPLMRLSEVYLNYAEAKAELGSLTQSDLEKSVNKIRARAKMPSLDMEKANSDPDKLLESYYPNVDKGGNKGVILEIRRERTVEMVMEGHRQWDMFRWKEGAQMFNTVAPYEGCYFPGPGTYDMDGDGKIDLELYEDSPSSSAATKKILGKEGIVLGSNGYIIAYSGISYNWNEERDYLWPIPAAQRVLNHNLTQNKGWSDGLDF